MENNTKTRAFLGAMMIAAGTVRKDIEQGSIPPHCAVGYLVRNLIQMADFIDTKWAGQPGQVLERLQDLHNACVHSNAENPPLERSEKR